MARQRQYNLEEQTHFAKTHQKVMQRHYMTDVDRMQIVDTENQMYHQYTYKNGSPIVGRVLEVKSKNTAYLSNILNGIKPPSQQMIAQSNLVAEMNGFRKVNGGKPVEYVIVIQNEEDYPYDIWTCDTTFGTGQLKFTYQGKVECDEEYEAYFTIK
jgi:hypothetical protein